MTLSIKIPSPFYPLSSLSLPKAVRTRNITFSSILLDAL